MAYLPRVLLAILFIVAGVMHFVIPSAYVTIIPRVFPAPFAIVLVSGALEIAGGAGLLIERTRRAAALCLAILLIAVWPANFQMLVNAHAHGASALYQTLLVLRLPIQIPLIYWTVRIARSPKNLFRDRLPESGETI